MALADYPTIEAAWIDHSESEMAFRRQVVADRMLHLDPQPDLDLVEAHHRACLALFAEATEPRRVASHDDDVREGGW